MNKWTKEVNTINNAAIYVRGCIAFFRIYAYLKLSNFAPQSIRTKHFFRQSSMTSDGSVENLYFWCQVENIFSFIHRSGH